jgi:hypothetical protein
MTANGTEELVVRAGRVTLTGDLTVPDRAFGVVAFAHGSGSGRHSPRNRAVAAVLYEARLATLLLDLLTEEEERFSAPRGQDHPRCASREPRAIGPERHRPMRAATATVSRRTT